MTKVCLVKTVTLDAREDPVPGESRVGLVKPDLRPIREIMETKVSPANPEVRVPLDLAAHRELPESQATPARRGRKAQQDQGAQGESQALRAHKAL